jgi:hypothetical protein
MRHTFVFAAPVVLSLLAGCPSTNSSSITADEFDAEFPLAACAAIEACAGETIARVFIGGAGGCDAAFGAAYRNAASPAYDQAIARGTVTFDGAQARACLEALEANPCTLSNNGAAALACQAVFEGTLPAGGACSLNEECGAEQFCQFTTACPGTCQARRTSGQSCTDERHCVGGLTCTDGSCVAPPGVGAGCTDLGGCTLGSLCTGGQCRPHQEVLVGTEGGACNLMTGPLCMDGLSCVVDSVGAGGATFVCRAAVAAGAECRLGIPAQCPVGQACTETDAMRLDFDGVCAPVPSTEGAACDLSGCAEGLRCVDEACVRIRENGEACTEASQCASGQCNGSVCVAPTLCGS